MSCLPQSISSLSYNSLHLQPPRPLSPSPSLLWFDQAAKATIMKRVEGYMERAETLKGVVKEQADAKNGMNQGGGAG